VSLAATTTVSIERPGLPRVTEILKNAGLIESAFFTDETRDRGSAVHAAAHYLDENDLDWPSVDPSVLPRLRQYQKFKDDVKPEILAMEEQVVNEPLQYAGRLDRRVKINGREGVLDLKGPSECAWHRLQIMYYVACFPRQLARWALYLSDARYKLVEFRGREDWEACKAILILTSWRAQYDRTSVQEMPREISGGGGAAKA